MTETYHDNSALDNFRTCPRKYMYRNVLDWAPEGTSHDLIFGLCWHAAMDIVWKHASSALSDADLQALAMAAFMDTWFEYYPLEKENPSFTDQDERFPKVPSRASDMVFHYIRRKRAYLAKYRIVGIETPFIVPLPEFTDTFYIGRKDKTYDIDGQIRDVDHKTSKVDSDTWKNTFFPNSQVDGYMYAGYLMFGDNYWGLEIDGALVQKGSPKSAREDYPPGINFMSIPIQRTL
jgi:PD-(D/E)XK nuclease superfamily